MKSARDIWGGTELSGFKERAGEAAPSGTGMLSDVFVLLLSSSSSLTLSLQVWVSSIYEFPSNWLTSLSPDW